MESVCRKKVRLLRMPKAKKLIESLKSSKFTAATVESENFHIQGEVRKQFLGRFWPFLGRFFASKALFDLQNSPLIWIIWTKFVKKLMRWFLKTKSLGQLVSFSSVSWFIWRLRSRRSSWPISRIPFRLRSLSATNRWTWTIGLVKWCWRI